MSQVPHRIRFVQRVIVRDPTPPETPSVPVIVMVPQQFTQVTRFSEKQNRMVEFWEWQDIPLVNEKDGMIEQPSIFLLPAVAAKA